MGSIDSPKSNNHERIETPKPIHHQRRFSNPFKKKKNKKMLKKNKTEKISRRTKSDFVGMDDGFLMSLNSLRMNDRVRCWECFVFIEYCNKFGNIGIAMIKDKDDGIAVLYKSGLYIDYKHKKHQNDFGFGQGNMIRINVTWKHNECLVSVHNIDSNKSVVIGNLGMFIKMGFILNKARITVIEQYWK